MNSEQAKIDIYLSQPVIKAAIDLLSLKYNFVVNEVVKSVLEDELLPNEVVDFLITEFDFNPQDAKDLFAKLNENVIEPFYVDNVPESHEDEKMPVEPDIKKSSKQIDWKVFIRPKALQTAMAELGKATSGDVARIRNYLWKSLGLGKAEEVIVVLNWLATTGELIKLWQEDNRFRGILKKYISVQYSEKIADIALTNKVTPAILGLALRMILEDKLALSSQDSAMVAMSIIDHMPDESKPKYILIAYVDSQDDSFNWNQIQASAESLQLAI